MTRKIGLRENYRIICENVSFLDFRRLTECSLVSFYEFLGVRLYSVSPIFLPFTSSDNLRLGLGLR